MDSVHAGINLGSYFHYFVDETFQHIDIIIGEKAAVGDIMSVGDIVSSMYTFTSGSLDSQIKNITDKNLILIGGPCANQITKKLFDTNVSCVEMMGLKEGQALLQLFENGKGTILLIAGQTERDTRLLATFVADRKMNNLNGTKFIFETINKTNIEIIYKNNLSIELNDSEKNISEEGRMWFSIFPVQCGENPWDEREEPESIKAYYENQGTKIYKVRKGFFKNKVCLACSCPRGDKIEILVSYEDFYKLWG